MFVKNADLQAHQILWYITFGWGWEMCILARSPGDLHARYDLKSNEVLESRRVMRDILGPHFGKYCSAHKVSVRTDTLMDGL